MKDKLRELVAAYPANSLSKAVKTNATLFSELNAYWVSKNSISPQSITALVHFYLTDQSPICDHGEIKRMGSLSQGFMGCGRVCKCNRDKNHEIRGKNTWTAEVRQKRMQTNMERYGVTNPIQNKKIKDKALATTKERFGVENVFESKEYQAQLRAAKNVENFSQLQMPFESLLILQSKLMFLDMAVGKTPKQISEFLQCSLKTVYDYIHKYECWDVIIRSPNVSYLEEQVEEFLIENQIQYERNTRSIISPKEIDFYLPDFKVGLELHGLYWHSEISGCKSKVYHVEKQKLAQAAGIHLIQIFEDEWVDKNQICKSKILNQVKQNTQIMARKCTIALVPNNQAKLFAETNHIQGHINASVKIGLYYDGELVFLMTFGKTRKPLGKSKYDWELYRMASQLGANVIGGASKVLSYFKRNFSGSIITYCDLRFGQGLVYKRMGFAYSHTTGPNYWYIRDGKRFYRYGFRKTKLVESIADPGLTEWQIMQARGYDRIWDCGHSVWTIG